MNLGIFNEFGHTPQIQAAYCMTELDMRDFMGKGPITAFETVLEFAFRQVSSTTAWKITLCWCPLLGIYSTTKYLERFVIR